MSRHTKEYRRKWYADNREHCKAYRKKWLAANPVRTAAYRAKSPKQHKERRAEFKKIIDRIKSVPCRDCDESYPPRVMEFDHLNPSEKKFTISRMVGRSTTKAQRQKILEEIKKCDIVCSNCHRLREIDRDEKR